MSQSDRLRVHPETRFQPPQLEFDLESVAAKLLAEPLPPGRTHRQETLYKHGIASIALFLLERGASLPPHLAEGVVFVHVLQGRIAMTAEGQNHDLPAGRLLALAPGVRHDLRAEETSRLLLTVCLET